mgnify:CR=1 FL=1
MDISKFVKKYKLSQEDGVDLWKHKQSGKYILTHDACTKIANIENIHTLNIECLHSSDTSIRLLITMKKYVDDTEGETEITIGEANKENVKMSGGYLGCMAEKRGKDRAILKLINAYEHGVASEVEADDYKYQDKSENVKEQIDINEHQDIVKIETLKGVEIVDDMKITFGKNKDKMVSECDLGYLDWLSNKATLDFITDDNDRNAYKRCAKYFHYKIAGEEAITF